MKREDVISLVRGYMMLDADRRDVLQAKGRPMCPEFMLQTLELNCPQWRKIAGLEEEVNDLILQAVKLHNLKF